MVGGKLYENWSTWRDDVQSGTPRKTTTEREVPSSRQEDVKHMIGHRGQGSLQCSVVTPIVLGLMCETLLPSDARKTDFSNALVA